MKKSLIIIASIFVIGGLSAYGQVGIGTATPNSESILDLTNSGNKGLLLPTASSTPTGTTPEGLLKYYQGSIYLTQTGGVNVINPWKYKYNSSVETMTFNPSSIVGVGIGINTAGVRATLHIAENSKQVSNSGTSAAFMIGDSTTTTHMLFDADEIMVKIGPSTAGLLKLQEEDGSLQIGSDRVENVDNIAIHLNTNIGSSSNHKDLNVNGKVKEFGNELLPAGSIIMWSGTNIPSGWALCNGNTKNLDGGGTIDTPDLRGRFIVGIKGSGPLPLPNGITSYNPNETGGNDMVTLSLGQMPSHNHSVSDLGHDHNYQRTDFRNVNHGDNANDYGFADLMHYETDQTTTASANIQQFNQGNNESHENRPKYFALAYIIKL